MPTIRLLIVMMLMVVSLVGGCAGQRDLQHGQQVGGAWPLDSLAYIYADPVAVAPVDDNPFRWLGFILNPVGVALDYVVNRPLYSLASGLPTLSGYTPEDATLHAQRPSRNYGNSY